MPTVKDLTSLNPTLKHTQLTRDPNHTLFITFWDPSTRIGRNSMDLVIGKVQENQERWKQDVRFISIDISRSKRSVKCQLSGEFPVWDEFEKYKISAETKHS